MKHKPQMIPAFKVHKSSSVIYYRQCRQCGKFIKTDMWIWINNLRSSYFGVKNKAIGLCSTEYRRALRCTCTVLKISTIINQSYSIYFNLCNFSKVLTHQKVLCKYQVYSVSENTFRNRCDVKKYRGHKLLRNDHKWNLHITKILY